MTGTISFDEGKPNGHTLLDAGVLITPQLVRVTPNIGSIGGMTIVATMPGVIKGQSDIMLTDAPGNPICDAVRVPEYGVVECDTKPQVITASVLKF